MTVQLHGHLVSTCTRAVIVTLKEANIPYKLIPVNLSAGEQKTPEYLENMHPFGQIPVLVEDDGFKVFESRAIARYVVEKYAPDSKLIPKGLKEKALFEQAMSIESNNFCPYASGYCLEKFVKPMLGLKGSDERAADYAATLTEKLKVYEVILGKQKYLAGDDLTLADLFHLPYGTRLTEQLGFAGLTATPNVARWWSDISSRESWKTVQAEMEEFMASIKK